ncbi:MAG: class I SAM-dependent rRNA methyltransferase, partial [Anaerolineales bacterium]|nr:class I SAM-dependent rRNA methyltransferase [Anaerolineales bacterium]
MTTNSISGSIQLKRKREKPVLNRHPWIFSGAIQQQQGDLQAGDLVTVLAADGQPLATAYYNPHSQIRARILSWEINQAVDESFWRALLQRAINGRRDLIDPRKTNAYRLVHGESDGLPGLIVDQYGDYIVMQCLTAGIDQRKEMLARLLADLRQPTGIIERSDSNMRGKEGLAEVTGLLWGEAPAAPIEVLENGFAFTVDLLEGHKTGFYLDQRDNRALLGEARFAAGQDVLNVFAYTGGFAVYAAAGGANHIINIDTSIPALELAEQNVQRAVGPRPQDEYIAGDAFQILRDYRDSGREFDLIILDPPKFAHS